MTNPIVRWSSIAALLILAAVSSPAQAPGPAAVVAAPTNLKILPPAGLIDVMRGFNISLGVQCTFCHVAGDFASDANPHKVTARTMIQLVRDVEPFFPAGGSPYPTGYHEVDCQTCHRGSTIPETKTVAHFIAPREVGRVNTETDLGVNMKALPPKTPVHGAFSIMEIFRDSLNVDCGFCHGGPGGNAGDLNPRKDIARNMIRMTTMLNAKFPGTGPYPEGKQEVSCYTCHRGDPHPASLSNKGYTGPTPAPAN
jgi:Photosynthetic reaction centre cytochrome C subunit